MPFKIKLLEQNISFDIKNNESILETALSRGHELPYGCRNGVCGSCKATLVHGEINYPGNTLPEGISEKEHKQGIVLLCTAKAQSNISLRTHTIKTEPKKQLPCRVMHHERLNHDVLRLILELPKTERLQFLAGQYIDIVMRNGKRRSFSIANGPHQDQLIELHIRYYKAGIFSEYAFNELKKGTILKMEGPFGRFTLKNSSRPIIMVAGGTGFAPIKSLIEHMLTINDIRPIDIYWGARTKADLYLDNMVKQWTEKFKYINYIPVLSDLDHISDWKGKIGLVHDAILADHADLSKYDIYACGPPPMIEAISKTLPEQGLNKEHLFLDSFEFAI